jgi:enamine deaminase RidA (YjgF/YER057c/UK114 family)
LSNSFCIKVNEAETNNLTLTKTVFNEAAVYINTEMRKSISSGTKWEQLVGYSRAVRVASTIYVSGTTATDNSGRIIGIGDAYQQTVQVIRNIESALERLDSNIRDVVRTRIYVKNIGDWEKIGRGHAEFFGEVKPATSMVQVSGFVDPEMLVEIEADAIAADSNS